MAKHILELQHIDFLYEKGSILFHNLLPLSKIKAYQESLSSLKVYTKRNIWQHSLVLQKLCFNHQLADLAAQLSRLKALRFGFDHYFSSFKELSNFFSENKSLEEMSSIDGLEIALLLNLSSSTELENTSSSSLPILSGSGTYFNTYTPLNVLMEETPPEGPFLLIAYCKANARYIHKHSDPFTHDAKKEKCGFGDLLANAYHPLVHY